MIAAFLSIYRKNRFLPSISCVIIWVLSSNPVVLVPHLATGFRFALIQFLLLSFPFVLLGFLHVIFSILICSPRNPVSLLI